MAAVRMPAPPLPQQNLKCVSEPKVPPACTAALWREMPSQLKGIRAAAVTG